MDIITKEKVFKVMQKKPRQRCFAKDNITCELDRNFNLPFEGSLVKLFKYETCLDIYSSQFEGYYLRINTAEELTIIKNWIEKRKELVFLRDCLDMSLALSFNVDYNAKKKTKLGELEYKAKHQHDKHAINTIVNIVTDEIKNSPFYKDADYICAVPAHPNKNFDLPTTIVATVSKNLQKADITKDFIFSGKKESIKDAELEKKWSILEQAKISYKNNLTGKTVILFDDKYQSGITMQYIAMKLYQAGAKQIYGLCFVKTMSNRDNINNDIFF